MANKTCPVCKKGNMIEVDDIEKNMHLKGEILISKIGKNKLLIEVGL